MKERPILFSAPMVRALLNGSKTQTRRIVKPQPQHPLFARHHMLAADDEGVELFLHSSTLHTAIRCPFGQPGDRLWVRETWGYRVGCNIDTQYQQAVIQYNADMKQLTLDIPPGGEDKLPKQRPCGKDEDYRTYYDDYLTRYWQQWRPSIFMPRWASRINLEITGVRVERLQDISEADAQAEGCSLECMTPTGDDDGSAIYGPGGYIALWESINGAGSWDANPWVWVVEFKSGTDAA